MSIEQAHELLRRFLSALSWTEGWFIRELFRLGGHPASRIQFGQAMRSRVVTHHFVDRIQPMPSDPRAKLALALYREALGASSLPYQVLGFFKIINIVYNGGEDQIAWMAATLPSLGSSSQKAVAELLNRGETDVARYLYGSCRCAVAHAHLGSTIVDPDSVHDEIRLRDDLPVIRELAEWLMKNELGLKR